MKVPFRLVHGTMIALTQTWQSTISAHPSYYSLHPQTHFNLKLEGVQFPLVLRTPRTAHSVHKRLQIVGASANHKGDAGPAYMHHRRRHLATLELRHVSGNLSQDQIRVGHLLRHTVKEFVGSPEEFEGNAYMLRQAHIVFTADQKEGCALEFGSCSRLAGTRMDVRIVYGVSLLVRGSSSSQGQLDLQASSNGWFQKLGKPKVEEPRALD